VFGGAPIPSLGPTSLKRLGGQRYGLLDPTGTEKAPRACSRALKGGGVFWTEHPFHASQRFLPGTEVLPRPD
jgi:hypothetical protein